MKTSELVNILLADDEREEVYIEIDGIQYDINVIEKEEVFDGFDTFYPPAYSLTPIEVI